MISPLHVSGEGVEFDYAPRTRIIFGVGASDRIGNLASELRGKRVLLVTDSGIVKAGHAGRISHELSSAGHDVLVFDRVHENPTTIDVDECVRTARDFGCDLLVGLGGGSSMDTAKGCNFLLTNGGKMSDYWGVGKARRPMLPLIAIPTTAGTGSECQSAALIADAVTHQKMACLDPKATAAIAILDPLLTLSQPSRVTACTGLDAIAHALESAVTTQRNPISQMYSRESFGLCIGAFAVVLKEPQNVKARGRMLLGAAMAGVAIENSMLGATHSAANPLTARHGIVHGHAVGLMLPAVLAWNAQDEDAHREYQHLARMIGLSSVSELALHLRSLLVAAGLPASLSACSIDASQIPTLAEEAARQWTAQFNPRLTTANDFAELYRAAF